MFCIHCGKEIAETAKVCGYCGTRQEVPEPPAPEHPPKHEIPEPPKVEQIPAYPADEPEKPAPVKEKKPRKGIPGWVWGIVGVVVILGIVWIVGPRAPDLPQTEDSAVEEPQEPEKGFQLLLASQTDDNAVLEYQNIRNFTDPIDFNRISLEGVQAVEGTAVVERDVYLKTTDAVRVAMGWCEVDWDTLYQSLEFIEMDSTIDGEPVEDPYWIEAEYEFEGNFCYSYQYVIKEWTPGIYHVAFDFIFTEDIYDHVLSANIPAGEMQVVYTVHVED